MRNAFFCTTPYQVLVAIALSKQVQGLSDIYVIDQFEKADQLVDVLKECNRFDKVQLIREYPIFKMKREGANSNKLRLRYIQIYLCLDKTVRSIIPDLSIYTDLFASCNSFVPRLFFLSSAKHRLNMNYHYYEDGIGSYTNKKLYVISGFDYSARRFIFGKRTVNIKYDLYLFNPEMFKQLMPDLDIKTHKIMPLQSGTEDTEIVDRIYSVGMIKSIQQNAVFFDTVHTETVLSFDHDKMMHDTEEILSMIGRENVIVKSHPRDTKKWFDFDYFEFPSVPLEVLCMHQDLSGKVLLSFFSTALFTPKMLFDQEPVLIMLYKVLGNTDDNELKDRFCSILETTYKDHGRIFIPETREELYGILNALKDK